MVPVIYHPGYQRYYFGPEHPFSPVRLDMLLSLLDALGHAVTPTPLTPATREDVLTVHDPGFVAAVEAASAGAPGIDLQRYGLGTLDVPAFAGMDKAARWLVGGTLHAARQITSGAAGLVFQLGGGLHHAQRALASGFCVYNDLSVAIQHFIDAGLRVAYIDVDVHHGDGVQWIHYDDHRVLTISLHESGRYLFPGTGAVHELGHGAGRGFKLNAPLEPGTTDDSYLEAFDRVVPQALSWFGPDVLVVMCGADAHFRDPLADLLLTTRAFETLFRTLRDYATQYAQGRALFTLGGGYDPDATVRVWALLYHVLQALPLPEHLPEAWRSHWGTHLGQSMTPTLHDAVQTFEVPQAEAIVHQNRQVSQRLMETAAPMWY